MVVSVPAHVRALAVSCTLSPRRTVAVSGRTSIELRHGPTGTGTGGGGAGGRFTVMFAVAVARWPRPLNDAVTVAAPGVRAMYKPFGEIELSDDANVTEPEHFFPVRSPLAVVVNVRLSPCVISAVVGAIASTHRSSGG